MSGFAGLVTCMNVHTYMHTQVYTHIHAYTHIHTHAYRYTHKHASMHTPTKTLQFAYINYSTLCTYSCLVTQA